MQDVLLAKTYVLAGRATRISRDSAVAMVRGAARAAEWTNHQVVSSARLLNPLNWRRRARRRPPRPSRPTPMARPAPAPAPAIRVQAPAELTSAEVSAAGFADATDTQIFRRALKDFARSEHTMRARAARALGGVRHELSVKALSARLARDPSDEVRKECVNSLTSLEMKDGLPAVKRALSDASPSVRLAAVRGAYRLAGSDSAPLLVRMFSDRHEAVRRRAAACAGWLAQEHLAANLVLLLRDESAFVRRAALDALGNLKPRLAAADIVPLLNDPEAPIRENAFDVLRTITGRQMAETLPEDEDGRHVLIARWRVWLVEHP